MFCSCAARGGVRVLIFYWFDIGLRAWILYFYVAKKTIRFHYIEYASINHDDGSVDLSCIVDVSAVLDRYDVYRSLSEANDFSKIVVNPPALLPGEGLLFKLPLFLVT